jgi:hypothetical protein
VRATFNDMCISGTGAQCRSYFVVLSLHAEYATHSIFDDDKQRSFMYMDYITYQGVSPMVAEQMMLQDLERCFRKSRSLLEKFGFPIPDGVPTELEEAISLWRSPNVLPRQGQLLISLNKTHPNNAEQQITFNKIMEDVIKFANSNREDITKHKFNFIGGPGETGKLALFKKLHAACRSHDLLISI